jgi:hypothetical protein
LSFARNLYYDLKPFLPVALRLALRRRLVRHQLKNNAAHWPIFPSAGTPPRNWSGWPGGKQFALVLTHDVEGPVGLANCEKLMELEMEIGFRSSFNFVPEGKYEVPQSLRERMQKEGFEVGVHDLHHNGKLYRSKERFDLAAPRINHYLREWNAVGFRSGFMHRNLDWLHALEIEYDMSTFDTDPFEPQPDGVHTIFPFWVPCPSEPNSQRRTSNFALRSSGSATQHSALSTQHLRLGYAELPYTLPQDSTLFLLLKETDCTIWKRKLDWIAECGGMALINVHPDYTGFESARGNQFPATVYQDLLRYTKSKYGNSVANLLPRTVGLLVDANSRSSVSAGSELKKPVFQ